MEKLFCGTDSPRGLLSFRCDNYMGNIISSSISSFLKVVGDLFGAPVDFLSGKSCSSVCGSTWDLVCYIENFCIANLLKLATVSVLFYIVMLFFYLLYKIGICHCVGRSTCKMLWACLSSCCLACEHGGMFVWFKMKKLGRMRRERSSVDMEYSSSSGEEISYRYNYPKEATRFRRSLSRNRSRERRRSHLERSLRPRSHRIRVGIGRSSVYVNQTGTRKHSRHVGVGVGASHNIKVTRTTKFVQKGSGRRIHHRSW